MKLPRCRGCNRRIAFFGSPFTGRPRAFEPTPVDPRTHNGPPAFPVLSGRAHRFMDLVEQMQVRHETTREQAEEDVCDMPWHIPHDCERGSDGSDSQRQA